MPSVIIIQDFGTARREAERLAGVARNTANLQVPFREIAADMMRIEDIMFGSSGRRGGGNWARLKEETIIKKGSSEILRTTGAAVGYKDLPGENILKDSLTVPDAPFQILKIFKNSIQFGTSRPFSYVHQHGSAKRHIPKREFLRFIHGDFVRWNNMISRHIIRPHRIK